MASQIFNGFENIVNEVGLCVFFICTPHFDYPGSDRVSVPVTEFNEDRFPWGGPIS